MVKKTTADDVDQEDRLVDLLRRKAQAYLRMPNVTSVGIGRRIKDGKETGELAIQFTVERKLAPEGLALEGLQALPTTIADDDGTEVPVDVLERSFKASYRILEESELVQARMAEVLSPVQARRSRLDTILPGISISHVEGTAGTFGAVVYDALNGTPYILSN
jgi:endonuclease G, mitochondrial